MKILVLGATGATGRQVVSQALARGHGVTAFVRSRGKLEGVKGDLRVVEGDITDRAAVSAALRGQDALVSTLGAAKASKAARSSGLVSGSEKRSLFGKANMAS